MKKVERCESCLEMHISRRETGNEGLGNFPWEMKYRENSGNLGNISAKITKNRQNFAHLGMLFQLKLGFLF